MLANTRRESSKARSNEVQNFFNADVTAGIYIWSNKLSYLTMLRKQRRHASNELDPDVYRVKATRLISFLPAIIVLLLHASVISMPSHGSGQSAFTCTRLKPTSNLKATSNIDESSERTNHKHVGISYHHPQYVQRTSRFISHVSQTPCKASVAVPKRPRLAHTQSRFPK